MKKLKYLIDSRDIKVLLDTRPKQWIFIIGSSGHWCCASCGKRGKFNTFKHAADCEGQAHWDAIAKLEKAIHGGGK